LPNTVAADRCGGACASQITRQKLIQQGVPLQRIKKTPKYSRPASGFVNFLAKKQSQKLQPLKGEEYKAWRASVVDEWRSLPEELKSIEKQEAETQHAERAVRAHDGDESKEGADEGKLNEFALAGGLFKSVLSEVGSDMVPYEACCF
jgi:hypothetical protein